VYALVEEKTVVPN